MPDIYLSYRGVVLLFMTPWIHTTEETIERNHDSGGDSNGGGEGDSDGDNNDVIAVAKIVMLKNERRMVSSSCSRIPTTNMAIQPDS